jgi:hypothetical protein
MPPLGFRKGTTETKKYKQTKPKLTNIKKEEQKKKEEEQKIKINELLYKDMFKICID